MSAPVYYLSHRYTGREEASIEEAMGWCYTLEVEMGLTVYSPIRETHFFAKWLFDMEAEEPPHSFWLKRDLAILEALMAGDGCPESFWCPKHGGSYTHNDDMRCDWLEDKECGITLTVEKPKFDSGVVMLLDDGSFELGYGDYTLDDMYKEFANTAPASEEWFGTWLSEGCRQEYEFCKQKFIRTCSLDHFLKTGELKEI